jgi:hypothetical protein
MMDVLSGYIAASDSAAAAYSSCVSSCIFSFQGFQTVLSLCHAVDNHIVKHTGLVVRIGDTFGLLDDGDCRHFPPALVRPSLAASCYGTLPDFIKSSADLQALADLYFSGDIRLAADLLCAL